MRNLSRFEDVSLAIGGSATGIYLAYPTSPELKPTYRGHRTLVNDLHTKIGVASKSFVSRENEYMSTFNFEVAFFPILEVSVPRLHVLESRVIAALRTIYPLSGSANEWFRTTERQAIAELVWSMHGDA